MEFVLFEWKKLGSFGLYVINDKNRNKDKKIKVIERISLSGEVITLADLEDFLTI